MSGTLPCLSGTITLYHTIKRRILVYRITECRIIRIQNASVCRYNFLFSKCPRLLICASNRQPLFTVTSQSIIFVVNNYILFFRWKFIRYFLYRSPQMIKVVYIMNSFAEIREITYRIIRYHWRNCLNIIQTYCGRIILHWFRSLWPWLFRFFVTFSFYAKSKTSICRYPFANQIISPRRKFKSDVIILLNSE